jgi:hypothetical protein
MNHRGSIEIQRSNSKIEKTTYESTREKYKRSKADRIFNNSVLIQEPRAHEF